MSAPDQLVRALKLHVEQVVLAKAPQHARRVVGAQVKLLSRTIALEAIEWAVDALWNGVAGEIPLRPVEIPIPSVTGRFSVMDNESPCDRCRSVSRVAIVDIQDGEVVSVECDRCAIEFKNGG